MIRLAVEWTWAGNDLWLENCKIKFQDFNYKIPAAVQLKLPAPGAPPWLHCPGLDEHLCSCSLQKRFWPSSQNSSGIVSQPLFLKTHRAKLLQSIHTKPKRHFERRTCRDNWTTSTWSAKKIPGACRWLQVSIIWGVTDKIAADGSMYRVQKFPWFAWI